MTFNVPEIPPVTLFFASGYGLVTLRFFIKNSLYTIKNEVFTERLHFPHKKSSGPDSITHEQHTSRKNHLRYTVYTCVSI